MNSLTKLASKLYPRWWRERYGDEFAALLEDARPGLGGTLDILKGALAAQLSTSSALKAVSVCTLAGVIGGVAVTYFVTPEYSSHAVLSVGTHEGATNLEAVDTINKYSTSILNRAALVNLVRRLDLYRTERSDMPPEDILELMRQKIRIAAVFNRSAVPAFEISFQYPDRAAATKVVNTLVTSYLDENLRAGEQTMQVLDPASEPSDPVFPRRKSFAAAGLGTGLLLGSLLALMLHLRRKRQPA